MDIHALAVILVAVSLGAIAKGATGMGLPLIAVPIIASFLSVQHGIVVLAIPIVFSNLWQVIRFREARHEAPLGFLPAMLIGCIIGVIVGTWLLVALPHRALELVLGGLLIGYIVFRLVNPHFTLGESAARRLALPVGLGAGVMHGSTGISAPVGVTFIHAMRFGRDAHIYAASAMFLVLSVVQVPALWVAGFLSGERLLQGLVALIPISLMMPVGQWLAGKLSARAFDRMILIFLGLIGIKMLAGL